MPKVYTDENLTDNDSAESGNESDEKSNDNDICIFCGKNFLLKAIYKEHILTCEHKRDVNGTDRFLKFRCKTCKRGFKYAVRLTAHEQNHVPPGGFVCKICLLPFTTDLERRNHKDKVHKLYKCNLCNEQFGENSVYLEHIRNKHNNRDREYFVCHECGCEFKTQNQLNQHNISKCGTQKTFQCDICNAKFMAQKTLMTHKLIHSGEKKHLCNYCAKSFLSKGQLKVHERSHTREKPFICQVCGVGFPYRESLVTHTSRHTGIKPYGCEACEKLFSCVGNLIKHRKTRPDTCGLPKYKNTKVAPRPSAKKIITSLPNTVIPKPEEVVQPKIYSKKKLKNRKIDEYNYTILVTKNESNEQVENSENNIESYTLKLEDFPSDNTIDENNVFVTYEERNVESPQYPETIQYSETENHNEERSLCTSDADEAQIEDEEETMITEEIKDDKTEEINDNEFVEYEIELPSDEIFSIVSVGNSEKIEIQNLYSMCSPETILGDQELSVIKIENSNKIGEVNISSEQFANDSNKIIDENSNSFKEETEINIYDDPDYIPSPNQNKDNEEIEILSNPDSQPSLNTEREYVGHLCKYCPKIYTQLKRLSNHLKAEHGETLNTTTENKIVCNTKSGFKCRYCNKKYSNLLSLEKHQVAHGPDGHLIHKCPLCKLYFATQEEVEKHDLEVHTDKDVPNAKNPQKEKSKGKAHTFICFNCGKKFNSRVALLDHERSKCGKAPIYKCNSCEKSYHSAGSLKTHQSLHTGELPHLCNFCGKAFRTQGQVKVHERKHNGEKPYKCESCPKAFAHRESLLTHRSLHTGIKRFMCIPCGSRFSCITNLQAHRKTNIRTCGMAPKFNKQIAQP